MQIRDLSIRQRLIFANYLMIIVPILLISLMGYGLFAVLDATGNTKQNELALLLPKSGPRLSVQFSLDSLIKQLNKHTLKLDKLAKIGDDLKEQSVDLAVFEKQKLYYLTPGGNVDQITAAIPAAVRAEKTYLSWHNNKFVFYYQNDGHIAYAVGNVPFLVDDHDDDWSSASLLAYFLEMATLIAIAITIAIIIALGLFLSRRLSAQILQPLDRLRLASSKIAAGELDFKLVPSSEDELGMLCREFDKMREQLLQARLERKRYEENRKELIAGISHDLSTPLTSVKGYASGILDHVADTPQKQEHYINMIYKNACNMEKLVENLFLFSKLDLGKIEFDLVPTDIFAYLNDYTAENSSNYAQNGLLIEFSGNGAGAKAAIDYWQFQRVIENLCKNSLRYKKSSTGHLQITCCQNETAYLITFADDGRGVAAEDLPKLFDSFYRTDKARSEVAKGSGLGLAIVKQIIAAFAGTIYAQGNSDGGLSIIIQLPLVKENLK